MPIESMCIGLESMRFYAYHGVLPQETQVGNYFTLDLQIWAEVSASLTSDALEDTVSYAELYEVIRREMAQPSKLLEHVVGRISRRILAEFPLIDRVRLTLRKDNPPFPGQLLSSSFTLDLSRD